MSAREADRNHCANCGAQIQWGQTSARATIKLDLDPVPLGRLYFDNNGMVRAWNAKIGRSVPRYNSHTCDKGF